jgi:hypothetical protein
MSGSRRSDPMHPPRALAKLGNRLGSASSNGRPSARPSTTSFIIMQHANDAIDEVRRAEFFRQGKQKRGLIKGKKWLLMSHWMN